MRGKQPNCDEPKGLLQQTGNDKMFSEKMYGTPVHKVQLPSGDKGITEKHEHKIPPPKASPTRDNSHTHPTTQTLSIPLISVILKAFLLFQIL